MAEKYSFFNAVQTEAGYDREYLAEDYAAYFASFIGNGVYANPASSLMVKAAGDMNIQVEAGKAWINGYFYENTSPKALQLDLADGATERIDRIVVRLDLLNRKITTEIKKGASSTLAVAPDLERDSDIYELGLADIKIRRNVVKITSEDITDLRMNKTFCGVVSGVVEQIDTSGLFAQYDEAFQTWFDNVKGTLSGDVAGNLLNLIQTHTSNNNIHVTAEEKSKWNNYKTVYTLTHKKTGFNHFLTGLPSDVSGLVSCIFTAQATYQSGNFFFIDKVQYTAKLSNGETPEDNLFVVGATVPVILDTVNKTINFKSGGGLSNTQLSLATATIAQVMQGFTFYAGNKDLKTGTYKPLKYATGNVQSKDAGTYDGDKWAWASGFDFEPFLVVIVDKWRKGDYQGIETDITVVAACINAGSMNNMIGNIGGYAEWDGYNLPDGEKMRMTASYGQFQIFHDDGGSILACSKKAQYFAIGY